MRISRTYKMPRLILWGLCALCILGLSFRAFAESLSSLRWESQPQAFIFHVGAATPIRYVTADLVDKEGFCIVDILNITQTYESRSILPEDSRIYKIEIASNPDGRGVRMKFFPRGNLEYRIAAGDSPNSMKIMFTAPQDSSTTINTVTTDKPVKTPLAPATPRQNPQPYIQPSLPSFSTPVPTPPPPVTPVYRDTEAKKRKLIIIDPGHGGKSLGARTAKKIKGKYYWEKDLVLGYAQKLKYLIDKSPNLTALMTRNSDEYVSLGDRVDFAQKNEGDYFVSIHLNDAPKPSSARGVEFFHWADTGATTAAMRYLESLENDQVLPKVSDSQDQRLKKILTGMLKDALEEKKILSASACEFMWQSFQKYSYFKTHHRNPSVKSAHFAVLANYAMPAILIEVGFMSNSQESEYLISDSFQWTTARLIYNGIQYYFAQEDPNFIPEYLN